MGGTAQHNRRTLWNVGKRDYGRNCSVPDSLPSKDTFNRYLLAFLCKRPTSACFILSRALETSQCCSPLLLETTCGQSSNPVLPPATFYAVWSPLNHQQSPTSNFLNSRGIYEMGFPRSQLQNTFISNHHPLSNIDFDFGTH